MKEQITVTKCDQCGKVIDTNQTYVQIKAVYKKDGPFMAGEKINLSIKLIRQTSFMSSTSESQFENSDFCNDECALDFFKNKLEQLSY